MTINTAPNKPLRDFKRTKMIATIGPSTHSYEAVLKMLKAGVNGFRLNFSHGTTEERLTQIAWIRKASKEYSKPVAIIQDLQGPKIRCGDFDGLISIKKGQEIELKLNTDYEKTGIIPTQYDLSSKVKRGERLYLYDGKVQCTITSVSKGTVRARAGNSGFITKRKGINLPDTDFGGDILTKKDKADIIFGAEQDIDYVAMSFVQTAADIRQLRKLLKNSGSDARVIAKIETQSATENLEEIIKESDAVMAARGDLAIETKPEAVPILTRQIIGLSQRYNAVSIVATQMLASMSETPEPTRAEVSDVATAVIVGADCLMLSDETASGDFPIESIETMKRIILYTQANMPLKPVFYEPEKHDISDAISSAVITLAHQVEASAIVAETKSGTTSLTIATNRPTMPIICVTSSKRTHQQACLFYGTKTFLRPDSRVAARKLSDWLLEQKIFKKGDRIVSVSGQYPGIIGGTDTIKVRVLE